jgi:hypothetical protein
MGDQPRVPVGGHVQVGVEPQRGGRLGRHRQGHQRVEGAVAATGQPGVVRGRVVGDEGGVGPGRLHLAGQGADRRGAVEDEVGGEADAGTHVVSMTSPVTVVRTLFL